jgi:hypothetical protein
MMKSNNKPAPATWKKEDKPFMLHHFGFMVQSKDKLKISDLRASTAYNYLIYQRKFTEKQVMNKIQWLKKSA